MCARGSRARARSSRSRSKSSQRADVTRESTTLEHIRVNAREKHAEHQNLQVHRNTLCAFVATPTASQNDSIHTACTVLCAYVLKRSRYASENLIFPLRFSPFQRRTKTHLVRPSLRSSALSLTLSLRVASSSSVGEVTTRKASSKNETLLRAESLLLNSSWRITFWWIKMATQTATCARIFSARRGGGKKQTTTTNKTTTFSRSSRNKTRTAVTINSHRKGKGKRLQIILRWRVDEFGLERRHDFMRERSVFILVRRVDGVRNQSGLFSRQG